MSEWKEVLIDNLCEVTSSKRIFYEEYVTSGIPFFRSKEIIELSNKQMVSTDLFITKEKFNSINDKFGAPAKDDILLTSVGTLGIPYLVPGTFDFYFKDGNLTWFRKWKNEINPLFFYWWLKSPLGYQALLDISIGSTQQALTISGLKGISFLLPPLQEQERIAEVLSSLDDKIDLLHRNNKTLEQLAEVLFRQWFVEQTEDSWEIGTVADAFEIKGGGTPATTNSEYWDGNIHWTSPRDLSGSSLVFLNNTGRKITESGLKSISSPILPIGTVLLSSRAPIGYLAITNIPVAINQGYIACLPNDRFSNYYIHSWLKENMEIIKNSSNGSTFMEISKGTFRQIEFILPPKKKLVEFNIIAVDIYEKIKSNEQQIQQLETLRDTLLPKLMSGAVRVEN